MATIPTLQIPTQGAVSGGADFSPLAQLPQLYAKYQQDQANKQALAQFQQTGDPRSLIGSGDMNLAQLGIGAQTHMDALKQQAIQNKMAEANLAINQGRYKHETKDWENTPDQYVANPKFGQPGEPQYIDQYAAATAASGNVKPIPFETLGGTKFMVPQPGGGYRIVDPGGLAGGQQGAPQPGGPAPGAPQPDAPQLGGPQPGGPQPTTSMDVVPGGPPPLPQAGATQQLDTEAVDPQSGRRENYLKSLDPQVQGYIKKIADYEIDPRTTSIKGGMREKLMSAVAQYDPTYNQNEFGTRAKAMKDFSTGQQGNSIRAFDVAIDHLDTLKKYATALGSGDIRVINSFRNKWLSETGSELPTNMQAIAPIVGAEVSKAVIGSNNALADREELRKPLLSANSVPQIMGAIGGYQDLMAGQLKGLKKQYEDTTGKKNFDTRIRENTRNVLMGRGGGDPVKVATPQEAAKLPPGTKIILPDGSPGVVPGG